MLCIDQHKKAEILDKKTKPKQTAGGSCKGPYSESMSVIMETRAKQFFLFELSMNELSINVFFFFFFI